MCISVKFYPLSRTATQRSQTNSVPHLSAEATHFATKCHTFQSLPTAVSDCQSSVSVTHHRHSLAGLCALLPSLQSCTLTVSDWHRDPTGDGRQRVVGPPVYSGHYNVFPHHQTTWLLLPSGRRGVQLSEKGYCKSHS